MYIVVEKPKMVVENIVASTKVDATIPLDRLLTVLEASEYEPEQFPGLVYRLFEPKVAFLLFSSGRVICAGAKGLADVKRAVEILQKRLKKIKM